MVVIRKPLASRRRISTGKAASPFVVVASLIGCTNGAPTPAPQSAFPLAWPLLGKASSPTLKGRLPATRPRYRLRAG